MALFNKGHSDKSDDDLIRAYKESGDIMYATDLFNKYHELVFGVCLKYSKTEVDSEDLTMQIYEKVVEKLKTHDPQHFKAWLAVMTKNHCLTYLRKEKLRKEKAKLYWAETEELIENPILNIEGLQEEQLIKLRSCLVRLMDKQKECITRFYFDEQPYKEIASQLDMSWSRVRSLIQNGRRNLKICIERS